jgi:hypothetical protein
MIVLSAKVDVQSEASSRNSLRPSPGIPNSVMQNCFYRSTFKLNIINISITPALKVVEPKPNPTS